MKKLRKRYPLTIKIAFVFAFSLLALFIPYYPLKIALGIIAIILLGLTFRRFSVLFIVLAIIFVVLPSGIIGIMNSSLLPLSFIQRVIPYYGNKYGFSASKENKKVYPDKFIKSGQSITLNVDDGLEIVFDPKSTQVEIPSELNVERFDKEVEISSVQNVFSDKTYVVNIGTKYGYKDIHIQSDGLLLKGKVAKKIGSLSINCDGIYLSGVLKADTFKLNCDGAYFNGEIDAKNVGIDADGVLTHLSLKNVQKFDMNCDGIAGGITYEDTWKEFRFFFVKASGGYLTVRVPKSAGELNRETEGVLVNLMRY